jgi:hypothetical protein
LWPCVSSVLFPCPKRHEGIALSKVEALEIRAADLRKTYARLGEDLRRRVEAALRGCSCCLCQITDGGEVGAKSLSPDLGTPDTLDMITLDPIAPQEPELAGTDDPLCDASSLVFASDSRRTSSGRPSAESSAGLDEEIAAEVASGRRVVHRDPLSESSLQPLPHSARISFYGGPQVCSTSTASTKPRSHLFTRLQRRRAAAASHTNDGDATTTPRAPTGEKRSRAFARKFVQ